MAAEEGLVLRLSLALHNHVPSHISSSHLPPSPSPGQASKAAELFSSLDFVKRCPPPASQAKSLRPALHPTHAPLQAWEHAHTPACGVRAAATMATSRRTCA